MQEESEGIRLNKYLSEIGHCSRRAADRLIEEGRVKINDKQVVMGQKVTPQDRIEVDGGVSRRSPRTKCVSSF